jgi:hypothetical protein
MIGGPDCGYHKFLELSEKQVAQQQQLLLHQLLSKPGNLLSIQPEMQHRSLQLPDALRFVLFFYMEFSV